MFLPFWVCCCVMFSISICLAPLSCELGQVGNFPFHFSLCFSGCCMEMSSYCVAAVLILVIVTTVVASEECPLSSLAVTRFPMMQ